MAGCTDSHRGHSSSGIRRLPLAPLCPAFHGLVFLLRLEQSSPARTARHLVRWRAPETLLVCLRTFPVICHLGVVCFEHAGPDRKAPPEDAGPLPLFF